MLRLEQKRFYQVRAGQTLKEIASAFCVSEFLLAKCNRLKEPPFAGQILVIPSERGNAYTVKAGDTKVLLCGSEENFERKNGTDILYLGMRVIL
ncbi:MAG: LysM peptidoglycan-binding domain-containing protein [Clostridia bacterium]|nr:LysM peptidoglycan-binding domain-containing protein [Clostridia bacterium]